MKSCKAHTSRFDVHGPFSHAADGAHSSASCKLQKLHASIVHHKATRPEETLHATLPNRTRCEHGWCSHHEKYLQRTLPQFSWKDGTSCLLGAPSYHPPHRWRLCSAAAQQLPTSSGLAANAPPPRSTVLLQNAVSRSALCNLVTDAEGRSLQMASPHASAASGNTEGFHRHPRTLRARRPFRALQPCGAHTADSAAHPRGELPHHTNRPHS